jgi:hypothetical protein
MDEFSTTSRAGLCQVCGKILRAQYYSLDGVMMCGDCYNQKTQNNQRVCPHCGKVIN